MGAPGNCNDELSGIAHEDDVARCKFLLPSSAIVSSLDKRTRELTRLPGYESSATAGDAACEFNGTVYPANGTPFPVPSATATPVANFANWMEKRDTTEECTTTSGAAALVTVTAVASYTDGYDSILTAATGSVPSSIVVESAPYPVVSTGSGTNMTAAATGTGVMSGSAAALTSLLTATGTPTIPASGAVASSSSGIATGAGSKSVNVNMFSGLMIGTVGAVAALLI